MNGKVIRTTLSEDFKALGMAPIEEDEGSVLSEGVDDKKREFIEEPELDDNVSEDDSSEEFVTKALLERISALPFDAMEQEDFDLLMGQLAELKIPSDDADLMLQTEVMVEMVSTRQRRFKAGKTSRKLSFQCPQGTRAVSVGGGGGRPMCRPSHTVVGGMGNLNKESRHKKKWSRGGKGVKSKMRSARVDKRRSSMRHEEIMSPLAMELSQISESVIDESMTVREDCIESMITIMSLLSEEFTDKSVSSIYESAVQSMIDKYEVGKLEEDVMNEDEFISEIEPVLSLITKSIEKVEDGFELGND